MHLAALSNDPLGDLDAELTFGINFRGTVALARAAKEAGVRRFVFASSCSMYGQGTGDAALAEERPSRPLTPYAESKVRAEEELCDGRPRFRRGRDAKRHRLRGLAEAPARRRVEQPRRLGAHDGADHLQSDGSSWRPIVHIRDIAEATLALVEAPDAQIVHRAYNIGVDTENYQVRELAEIVQRHAPECTVAFADGASPDPRSYRVDFSRFATGFPDCRLAWTADAGAAELLAAYREIGLTRDLFEGRRFVRLGQIRRLRDAGLVDDALRWSASG